MSYIRTVYVEKKEGFNSENEHLLKDFKINLNLENLEKVRLVNRYDLAGLSDDAYDRAKKLILSEVNVDNVYNEEFPLNDGENYFLVQYLPGQFDQRADSARQCIQIITEDDSCEITSSKVVILKGKLSIDEIEKVKSYFINSVDSREISIEKPETLMPKVEKPSAVKILDGFIDLDRSGLENFLNENGLAMTIDDLAFCQQYFRDTEKRNPTITEIKVIDTYWSDHCRHTTFETIIDEVSFEEGKYASLVKASYENYLAGREFAYKDRKKKNICLMDLATIAVRELKKKGVLTDLDESEEINACSINVKVDVDGKDEDYLLMFKNETHNHPTEIEPFGGAATCIGGAIRDPLSGRTYVYQAMRVSGAADPTVPVEETLPGKLPQRKITQGAAHGYSSYGNQIGLATGQVAEIYHPGYVAKRLELGAVVAAAPKDNVVRRRPVPGDIIVLIGGRTGRDGCGGATGSSKEHTETSIDTCSSEVQKGNAPTERKIQRLFRNPDVSRKIVRCNDFGAGGVSVAIGELADGLDIDLDLVPKKYEGLDGTELAISESQERMAVVIEEKDREEFLRLCNEENLEAVVVAKVTDENIMRLKWRGDTIVELSRDFLNTNGVTSHTKAKVVEPKEENYFETSVNKYQGKDFKTVAEEILTDLNVCSQRGLVEMFDSSIGSNTVLMPYGGKTQGTPQEGMVGKIPVLEGETNTVSLMTFGYNPYLTTFSPFHGGMYSVIEALAKITALGGDASKVRLSMQEYFERMNSEEAFGKPLAALLGAYEVQRAFEIPAIGGKDSMSGTFKDLKVPPTIVTFAVVADKVQNIVSSEFKKAGSKLVEILHNRKDGDMPNLEELKTNFAKVKELINKGLVLSSSSVRFGGLIENLAKGSFGNEIGVKINSELTVKDLVEPSYGSIVLEVEEDTIKELEGVSYRVIGETTEDYSLVYGDEKLDINELRKSWDSTLESVFRTEAKIEETKIDMPLYEAKEKVSPVIKIAKPKVFIPVFPGTNCEYDTSREFKKAGAETDIFVFRNGNAHEVEESIEEMVKRINTSQMIMLSGGFSAGDEPDGSGKFISAVFRNEKIKEAVHEMLKNRDGLMLGICNGFQALIKLGLVPYGEIRDLDENSPTLTFNKIGRHVSRMVTTKVVSNKSPWIANDDLGKLHSIAVSHGEGRFVANDEVMKSLIANGQVATQYVNFDGQGTYDIEFNPNGSVCAVEGITSPDGRVFGKMGHSERIGNGVAKNIFGEKDQQLFKNGVNYFK